MKKGKQNTGKLELNFLQITILKAIKQTPCLSFWACEKKKNYGIYWLDSYNVLTSKNSLKSSKQWTVENDLSIYVSNKYTPKECLCISTIPKFNASFIAQICAIYKPEKSLKWYKQHK